MAKRLTEDDGRRALRDHVLERARVARLRYGPAVDAAAIMKMLDDREIVRFAVGIRFDTGGLEKGEFAQVHPLADHPSGGFCLYIHPALQDRTDLLPAIIAYYIPAVNYGDITEPEDCEAFGASLLGIGEETYYEMLCGIADELPARE